MNSENLSSDERRALEMVDRGLRIDEDMKQRLVKRGLVKTLLGGLALTTKGQQALRR